MLVLTRRLGQDILIGNIGNAGNIRVTVTRINGERIRLGIEAPRDVAVYRGEIYRKIQKGKKPESNPGPHGQGGLERDLGPEQSGNYGMPPAGGCY